LNQNTIKLPLVTFMADSSLLILVREIISEAENV
jgi:hypothetical protein